MKKIAQVIFLSLLAVLSVSCSDEFTDDIVRDNKPDVPVTFTGATTAGFNPYYSVSISGAGTIAITMEIPATSGRTIKQVKKVIAGGTSIIPGNLSDGTIATYAASIDANATSFTFNTSITEFNSKVAGGDKVPATVAAGTFAERAFYFDIVLDNDQEIIPVQCRIRFVP